MSYQSSCEGFDPDPCLSYSNCTQSDYIGNWTEICCQPEEVKDSRYFMLAVIGGVATVGAVCNFITISTFIYLYCFPERIKRRFCQEFSMIKDPVFFLIFNLSICDFLYCFIGLPSYWIIYYYGYFPFSERMCKYFGFFRKLIAYVDFNSLAAISAYFASRRGRGQPCNEMGGVRTACHVILCIWTFSLCLTFIPLFRICGEIGYDAVNGMCHVLVCEKCSAESEYICPPGLLLEALGVGVPSLVIICSYTAVYRSLSRAPADAETFSLKRSVLILSVCYFIFILPNAIIYQLPYDVSLSAIASAIVHCWYWFIYVVNFFIYITFWRRVRVGIQIFVRDILKICGFKPIQKSEIVQLQDNTSIWWIILRTRE